MCLMIVLPNFGFHFRWQKDQNKSQTLAYWLEYCFDFGTHQKSRLIFVHFEQELMIGPYFLLVRQREREQAALHFSYRL